MILAPTADQGIELLLRSPFPPFNLRPLRRAASLGALSFATVLLVVVGAGDQGIARGPSVTLPPTSVLAKLLVPSPFLQLNVPGHALHLLHAIVRSAVAQSPIGSDDVAASGVSLAALVPDVWGPVTTLRTPNGGYASPIHVALLPDGRVVMVGIAKPEPGTPIGPGAAPTAFALTPLPVGAATPPEITIAPIDQPVDVRDWISGDWVVNDDLACMGQALTADGKLFTAGGTRSVQNRATGQLYLLGLPYATTFDGQVWSRVAANMRATATINQPGRWYPTVTRLPDARLLVTGGFDVVVPSVPTGLLNLSAEIYDPTKGGWTIASAFGQTPFDIMNSDYTHQFVLPSPLSSFDILMFGEPGVPVLMSTRTSPAGWLVRSEQPRPGSDRFQSDRNANGGGWVSTSAPNNGAASAMLPNRSRNGDQGYLNGTVLIAGGALGTVHAQAIDVYDPTTDQWQATINTGIQRHDASTVVLPDGRVLVINGHSADAGVRRAAYVDPTNGFTYSLGASDSGEVRGYHSVALLLPDGRVLVGGGRDITTESSVEKPSFRYYYPPYMFAARPRIVSAPTTLGYGETSVVTVSGAAPAEAVLVSLGSMTHEFDSGQRSIQLALTAVTSTSGTYVATIVGPASSQIAPPGYYMLFILDGQRIPSAATMVHVR